MGQGGRFQYYLRMCHFSEKKSTPIVKVQLTERTGRLQIQLETCRVQDTEETDAAKRSKKEEAWFRDEQMNDRYIMSRQVDNKQTDGQTDDRYDARDDRKQITDDRYTCIQMLDKHIYK